MEPTRDADASSIKTDSLTPAATLPPEAFEHLYNVAWPLVVNYLRFRIGPIDAQDVAADVFVCAWAARAQFDPARGTPAAWLWGIARNSARAWHRAGRAPSQSLPGDVIDDAAWAERAARAEIMGQVAAALTQLAPIDQEIVALRFGAGLSYRAIGESVGISETATGARLHRAVRRLRLAFEGGGEP